MAPRLSVVIATHNRPVLLTRTVGSILAQDFEDFELILVDDASGAEAREAIASLAAQDPRIRTFRNDHNLGPAGARNLGIAEARGELVAITDDDDLSVPHRFRVQVAIFDRRPDVGLVCSAVRWVDADGGEIGQWPAVLLRGELPDDSSEVFRLLYLQSNKIPNTSLMARTELLRRFPYPDHLWVGEDWVQCMRMAASGVAFAGVAEPLVDMRRDREHESMMANKARAFEHQRRGLREMRTWLADQGMSQFDDLHRRAWSNQLAREARFWGGPNGLLLAHRAVAVSPANGAAWRAATNSWVLAARKLGRVVGLAKLTRG